MQPGQDPLGPPQSFTARRSAASNLPSFELPPPSAAFAQKFPTFPAINAQHPGQVGGSIASVGNLLTPPNTLPSDSLSPISSDIANSNASSSAQQTTGYAQNSLWPQPSQSPNQYAPYTANSGSQWSRGQPALFSPGSLASILRSVEPQNQPQIPTSNEFQLPPFNASMPMAGPATLPAMMTPQQQQQQAMTTALFNTQAMVANAATQPSPVHSQDPYAMRSPSNPQYYNHTQPSPASASGFSYSPNSLASQNSASRFSPQHHTQSALSGLPPNLTAQPPPQQYAQQRNSYHQYNLPAATASQGPILSNLHNPNGHMSLVGANPGLPFSGLTSGQAAAAANLQQVYSLPGQHPHPSHQQSQSPHADRPFKCDQCQQSFNRNHDLKRHKRIHLAVKPYPCNYCDKSFSRKDALKVIILYHCGLAQS